MNNFKNNHRRGRFKLNGDRNFRKRNGNGHKTNGDFNNGSDFKRRNPGKNNQNAAKLVEKYNDLAREALSNGDKILSENYLQHADHFTRILNERESFRKEKFLDSKSADNSNVEESIEHSKENSQKDLEENSDDNVNVQKGIKSQAEIN